MSDPRPVAAAAGSPVRAAPAQRTPRIDVHTHMLNREASAAGVAHSVVTGFGTRQMPPPTPGTAQAAADQAAYDVEAHVAMLDRLALDAEIVSSLTVMQGTSWASPQVAHELNRAINDEIAAWVATHPTRLIGSFTLPLQSRELTLEELHRCVTDHHMKVVQLPTAVGGTYLSAPEYRYLWETIAELGLMAFVHPDGTRDPWFQSYSMWNSVGQPIEETKFIASLIYEGVLEQLPRLMIVMAHGGGYLPHYYGRLDRNVRAHPHSAANISRRPSEYLRSLFYDTCLYEPTMLEALVARVGADRIVMGSDYPVGDPDPGGFVERCPALGPEEIGAVLGGTVAHLLHLTADTERLGVSPAR